MTSTIMGRVVALYRYPVKSMAAESLETVKVGWNGFDGDRRWAFVREGTERNGFPWLTIRQNARMWLYRPYFVDPADPNKSVTMVRTPEENELDVVDPMLALELGHGARILRQTRGIFDTLPLSLISNQAIYSLGASLGNELDARRFRPNFVIEAADGGDAPEDSWIGYVVRIGDIRMRIDQRDKRCIVVNVDPATAEKDPSVLRTITEQSKSCLGVYGSTITAGTVSVGDRVTLER